MEHLSEFQEKYNLDDITYNSKNAKTRVINKGGIKWVLIDLKKL